MPKCDKINTTITSKEVSKADLPKAFSIIVVPIQLVKETVVREFKAKVTCKTDYLK